MATSIGDLIATLGVNNKPFKSGLTGAQASLMSFAGKVKSTVGSVAGMFGVGIGVGGLGYAAKIAIAAYTEAEQSQRKLGAVIQATGGAAGLTQTQMMDYAAELQRVTNFEDDATIGAMGFPFMAVGRKLGVPLSTIITWRQDKADIWAKGFEAGMVEQVQSVREQAGTDAIMVDPDRYLKMAENAEKWLADKGETLFHREPGDMTLQGFYDSYYRPNCLNEISKSTLALYDLVLRRWRLVTGDPPLAEITVQILARFRDFLRACRGQAPGSKASLFTVVNYLRYVNTILNKAGPPGYRNRDAADIIPRVPWIKPPKVDLPQPKIADVPAIEAAYNAAGAMVVPQIPGIAAADWWKALLVTVFNTGLRRRTLFSITWAMVDLDNGRIEIPADNMKSRRHHRMMLHPMVVEHLRRIQRAAEQPVFPWPYDRTHFNTVFHRLQYDAGIPLAGHFGLHSIRKTFATNLCMTDAVAAQLALGHAGLRVTLEHYVNDDVIVSRAINALPQPAAFTRT
jgi:integrase